MQVFQDESVAAEKMSQAEQDAVRLQLERLLETHHFKNSRRYPALLRFIVEETLAGRGEYLKERLLGVRVFDRPADYDTATDPVVRVTIAEIRKRIAQYYHDEAHDAEMRIELLPGRYEPEFRARATRRETIPEEKAVVAESVPVLPLATPALSPREVRSAAKRMRWQVWAVPAAAVCLGLMAWFVWGRPTPLDELWRPVLAANGRVLFCIPTDVGRKRGPVDLDGTHDTIEGTQGDGRSSGATFLAYEALGENVVYSDMLAAARIVSVLAVHGRQYRFRLNVRTTLDDLRQGPTVLIGGLDNQWTMRSLAPLRFHFLGSDEAGYWVSDRSDPANHAWLLNLKQQYGAVTRDYAIVARLHDEQSGQPEMIVAGIGMSGTAAAGEFLTDPDRMAELKRRVGAGFKDRDFEVVLSTSVVNGIPGAPKILAVSVW
jgi:hypothetical protein